MLSNNDIQNRFEEVYAELEENCSQQLKDTCKLIYDYWCKLRIIINSNYENDQYFQDEGKQEY
ncbi:hypothetical protein [Yeosuana sp.]|uniref:hypothetical protein n=1 Tax=Yeosuana sp. TaxID=2529388 RepID=UPI004054F96E|tara:strand:- start:68 stop:256 length:189 start_codon:yes stop_codon:yes gene_type:complete